MSFIRVILSASQFKGNIVFSSNFFFNFAGIISTSLGNPAITALYELFFGFCLLTLLVLIGTKADSSLADAGC